MKLVLVFVSNKSLEFYAKWYQMMVLGVSLTYLSFARAARFQRLESYVV